MTVFLKWVTRSAVKHMIAMCGNMIEESGMKRVAEELLNRDPLAREQGRGLGLGSELGDHFIKAAEIAANHEEGCGAKAREKAAFGMRSPRRCRAFRQRIRSS